MKPDPTSLRVAIERACRLAVIQIGGRATFSCSTQFRDLVNSLCEKCYRRFVLDLSDCLLMDSTFLGVLVGLGKKSCNGDPSDKRLRIELLNANPRIADLLDTLGVTHLFVIANACNVPADSLEPVEHTPKPVDPAEALRTSIEAHCRLIDVNPGNLSKFKDVIDFMREDLKKLEADGANPPSAQPPRDGAC